MDAIKWAELAAEIAAGGLPSWIAAGVILLLFVGMLIWWKAKEAKLIDERNEQRERDDHASTPGDSQGPENDLNDGQDAIDEIRNQNPDGGKEENPPEE